MRATAHRIGKQPMAGVDDFFAKKQQEPGRVDVLFFLYKAIWQLAFFCLAGNLLKNHTLEKKPPRTFHSMAMKNPQFQYELSTSSTECIWNHHQPYHILPFTTSDKGDKLSLPMD